MNLYHVRLKVSLSCETNHYIAASSFAEAELIATKLLVDTEMLIVNIEFLGVLNTKDDLIQIHNDDHGEQIEEE